MYITIICSTTPSFSTYNTQQLHSASWPWHFTILLPQQITLHWCLFYATTSALPRGYEPLLVINCIWKPKRFTPQIRPGGKHTLANEIWVEPHTVNALFQSMEQKKLLPLELIAPSDTDVSTWSSCLMPVEKLTFAFVSTCITAWGNTTLNTSLCILFNNVNSLMINYKIEISHFESWSVPMPEIGLCWNQIGIQGPTLSGGRHISKISISIEMCAEYQALNLMNFSKMLHQLQQWLLITLIHVEETVNYSPLL